MAPPNTAFLGVSNLSSLATLQGNDVANAEAGTIFIIQNTTANAPASQYFYALCYGVKDGNKIVIAVSTNLAVNNGQIYIGSIRVEGTTKTVTWNKIAIDS